jgi:hypothetical protein
LGFSAISWLGVGIACEEAAELGEELDEEVFASEIGDDALLDLTAVAVGFDDADIFVDGAAGGADFDGSRVHENHYHDELTFLKGNNRGISTDSTLDCHYTFRAGEGQPT